MNESEVLGDLKRKFDIFIKWVYVGIHRDSFANDGNVRVGINQFFDLLSTETSFAANFVELIQSIVQPLSAVRDGAGEDRILVDASDEIVLQSKLHKFPFIDVMLPWRETSAKRLQVNAVRHLRIKLKHSIHARSFVIIVERHKLETLLAQMLMLR